jgi:DNA mismatch endonuclease (patch repair protein)
MKATKATSRAEQAFRKRVWAAGIRGYRVHPRLPGRPDLYFSRHRLAVFIHGCFWHRCQECGLHLPAANREFWARKFEANLERDKRVVESLSALGIRSVVIWEHEIRSAPQRAIAQLAQALRHI